MQLCVVLGVEPHRMWVWIIDEDGQEVRIRFRQCMTSLYWSLAQGLPVCPVSAYSLTHIHIGVYSVFSHFVCFNFLVFTVFMPQMYTKPDHIKDFLLMNMTWYTPEWSIYRKHEKNSKTLLWMCWYFREQCSLVSHDMIMMLKSWRTTTVFWEHIFFCSYLGKVSFNWSVYLALLPLFHNWQCGATHDMQQRRWNWTMDIMVQLYAFVFRLSDTELFLYR